MAHTFSDTGTIAGRSPELPTTQRTRLNLPARSRWWFKHHPARWVVMEGEILPLLGKLSGEPGVNGTDKSGDTAGAEINATRRGWKMIPWNVIEGGYIRVFDGRKGPIHLSKWEHPKQIANRTIIKSDMEGYKAFLRKLVTDGIIAPPDPDIIEAMAEAIRSSNDKTPNPDLVVLDAYLNGDDGAAAPLKKRRKGGSDG